MCKHTAKRYRGGQILFSLSALLQCTPALQLKAKPNLLGQSFSHLEISRICSSQHEALSVFYSSTKLIQSTAILMSYYFRFSSHIWIDHLEIKNGQSESVSPLLFTSKSKISACRQWFCGPAIPCWRHRGEWWAAKISADGILFKRLEKKDPSQNSTINLDQKMCVASNHESSDG